MPELSTVMVAAGIGLAVCTSVMVPVREPAVCAATVCMQKITRINAAVFITIPKQRCLLFVHHNNQIKACLLDKKQQE
jgi:hypothetical protein